MMIDLKNTYIENDFGELRDAFIKAAESQGYKKYDETTGNDACFNCVMVDDEGDIVDCRGDYAKSSGFKLLTLSDLKGIAEKGNTEWNGEGLPPKGEIVRFDNYDDKCVAYGYGDFGTEVMVVETLYDEGCCVVRLSNMLGIFDKSFFRPIETPEQKAAREREKTLAHMFELTRGCCYQDACFNLYDAGYRKPECREAMELSPTLKGLCDE